MFNSRRRTNAIFDLLTWAIVGLVVAFSVFPLLWTLLTSLKLEQDIVTRTLQYIPRRLTFQNYLTLWRQSGFPNLVLNSVVVTL